MQLLRDCHRLADTQYTGMVGDVLNVEMDWRSRRHLTRHAHRNRRHVLHATQRRGQVGPDWHTFEFRPRVEQTLRHHPANPGRSHPIMVRPAQILLGGLVEPVQHLRQQQAVRRDKHRLIAGLVGALADDAGVAADLRQLQPVRIGMGFDCETYKGATVIGHASTLEPPCDTVAPNIALGLSGSAAQLHSPGIKAQGVNRSCVDAKLRQAGGRRGP